MQNGACDNNEQKVKSGGLSSGLASGLSVGLLAGLAGVTLAGGLASPLHRDQPFPVPLNAAVLDNQRLAIERDARRFDGRLRQAEQSARRFARQISYRSDALEAPSVDPEARRLTGENSLERGPDGSLRSRQDRFQSRREAGLFLPAGTALTPETRRFLEHAQAVTRRVGQGNREELVVNSWVLPHAPGLVLFGPESPRYLFDPGALPEAQKLPRVEYSAPLRSPAGQPRWTPPTYDPATRKWVMSVVAPFFRNGRWAGAVGHDLALNRMLDNLQDPQHGSVPSLTHPLYLSDRDGHLLAARQGLRSREQRLPERYRPFLEQARRPGGARVFASGPDHVVVAPIPTIGAYAFYRVESIGLPRRRLDSQADLAFSHSLLVVGVVGGSIVWLSRERPTRS